MCSEFSSLRRRHLHNAVQMRALKRSCGVNTMAAQNAHIPRAYSLLCPLWYVGYLLFSVATYSDAFVASRSPFNQVSHSVTELRHPAYK